MPAISPFLFAQFFDNNGNPLAGGTLDFYATGTTNRLGTYSDQAGAAANSNPLTLDSAGRSTIFLGPDPYDVVLKNSAGTTIATISGVSTTGGGGGASLQTTSTLATFRLLSSGSSDYVLLGGTTAVGDGGSSFYYWSSTSSAADDGINVIRPSSNPATGRWLILPQNGDSAGTFAVALTGVTPVAGVSTGFGWYTKKGKMVSLHLPNLSGVSITADMTVTGLPAAIRPTTNIGGITIPSVLNNSNYYPGLASINDTYIAFEFRTAIPGNFSTVFTASGVKGISGGNLPTGLHINYSLP